MVEVGESGLSEVQESGLSEVQESDLPEESHQALGESLRSGETNRKAEESRPAASGATLVTTQGSTVHCPIRSTTFGNGPSLATAAGRGSSAHSSGPPRSSTNHPMAPTAFAMWWSRPRLHLPH
jgi:hypothetical protein